MFKVNRSAGVLSISAEFSRGILLSLQGHAARLRCGWGSFRDMAIVIVCIEPERQGCNPKKVDNDCVIHLHLNELELILEIGYY